MISPAQCRAARGLLQISQREIAEKAGIAAGTVVDFENRKRLPQRATLAILRQTFERLGVTFIDPQATGDDEGATIRRAPTEPAPSTPT